MASTPSHSSDSSQLLDAPLLISHQCMPKEWKLGCWGRESAKEFARNGFAVLWVPSVLWRDLKTKDPQAFRHPYIPTEMEQQMICTIVMRDITCPLIQDIVQQMRRGTLPSDLRKWDRNLNEFELELPPGGRPCTPSLDIIGVTEASAMLAAGVTPRVFRAVYQSYPHRLVWAGFNAVTRCTGSKLRMGEPEDFALLKMVFERLKVWHIDQQYKCFQNDYFTVVYGRPDILVGYRDHVSGCCDRHANSDDMLGASWAPTPKLGRTRSSGKDSVGPSFGRLDI